MNFKTFKTLAVTSASALALFAGSEAFAQATANVTTTFTTGAALAAANVSNMDFGTWVVNVGGTDNFTIDLPADVGGAPGVVACTLPGVPNPSSVCSQLVAPATSGVVSVTSPVATDVQIQGNVVPDFADPALSLGTLTFDDATGAVAPLPSAFAPADTVTVVGAGVAENVGIGATLTIGGGAGGVTPPASTTFNDAIVVVDFQF